MSKRNLIIAVLESELISDSDKIELIQIIVNSNSIDLLVKRILSYLKIGIKVFEIFYDDPLDLQTILEELL